MKTLVKGPVVERMRERESASIKAFADIWYSPSTREQLRKTVLQLPVEWNPRHAAPAELGSRSPLYDLSFTLFDSVHIQDDLVAGLRCDRSPYRL